jgi:hypothetical protein
VRTRGRCSSIARSATAGSGAAQQLLGGHGGNVLRVHPEQLLGVEDRRRGADLVERELVFHLRARQDLAIASGRPAEQRQEVEERLGQDPLVAPLLDRGGAVALGELLAVRPEDHAEVRELRDRRAEGAEERDVLGRVGQMVVAADDVRDPHVRVVHADAEVIQRVAVGAHEDEIVEGVGREIHPPADEIVHDEGLVRHAEANDVALTGRRPAVALLERDRARCPRVAVGLAGRLGLLALGVELLGRFEGPVGLALPDEPVGRLLVEVVALRLEERPLVVVEAEPLHRREDLPRQLFAGALDVGVLDAQEKRAARVPREEQVVEGRPRSADVERARRGRRKTDAGRVWLLQGARC